MRARASLTPLFLAIGLPAEGIGLLIAVDAIPDTFATVLNTTGNLAATALVASRADEETTASPSYSLLKGAQESSRPNHALQRATV